MSEDQIQRIYENNVKVKAVIQVITEALVGDLEIDVVSMIDIIRDYTSETDKIISKCV